MRTRIGDSFSMFLFSMSATMRSESGCRWRPPTDGVPSVLQPASAIAAAIAADARSVRTKGRRFKPGTPPNRLPHKKASPEAFIPSTSLSLPNGYPEGTSAARRRGRPVEHADGEWRVNFVGPEEAQIPHIPLPVTVAKQRLGED